MKRKNTNKVKNQAIVPEEDIEVWSSDGILPAKHGSAVATGDSEITATRDLVEMSSAFQDLPQVQPPAQLSSMRTYITSPQTVSVMSEPPATVDVFYNYNYVPIDYGGQVKNTLVMHMAEVVLTTKAETPEEAARFFPGGHIPERLLDPTPLRLPDNAGQDAVSQTPALEMASRLATTQFRLLMLSTYCDFDLAVISIGDLVKLMLQKAYGILREEEIDSANPYLVDIESLIPQQSRYRLGLFLQRPFKGLVFGGPVGDMGAWQEDYCLEAPGASYSQVWPLRSLTKAGCGFIKPCFLPHRRYSLWGLDKILFTNVQTIVLTPDLREYFYNYTYCGMATVSWFGAQYTLPKVDFSPLAGRTVHYVFNPGSFNGDYQTCLACMNGAIASLVAFGCNVNVMANPQCTVPFVYGAASPGNGPSFAPK